jgi:hypothetical protein
VEDSIKVNSFKLQIGGQVDYLFGEVVQQERLDIQDITFLDSRTSTIMRHRALGGLFGLQFHKLLGAKYDDSKNFLRSSSIYLGVTYATSSILNTDYEKIVETIILMSGVETLVDTTFYSSDVWQGQTPSRWSAGAAFSFESGNGRRLMLAADMMKEDWTSISTETNDYLLDGNAVWAEASRLSAGMSIKPGIKGSSQSSFARTTYKAGFALDNYPISYIVENYNGDTLALKSQQLKGWRANVGFSMPLEGSRSNSRIHFGVSYGKRSLDGDGTVLDNALEESILNIQIGVSLAPFFKNLWLMPKLYD